MPASGARGEEIHIQPAEASVGEREPPAVLDLFGDRQTLVSSGLRTPVFSFSEETGGQFAQGIGFTGAPANLPGDTQRLLTLAHPLASALRRASQRVEHPGGAAQMPKRRQDGDQTSPVA